MGRFGVPKSVGNRYFFYIHLGSVFVDFLNENEGFGSPKQRSNFSKNRSQGDSLEMSKKCIDQVIFRDTQPLGPETSPGGLHGEPI